MSSFPQTSVRQLKGDGQMTITTASVAAATTPVGAATFFAHYVHKHERRVKSSSSATSDPRSQLSYDEGLSIVRRFLQYASKHTVSDLQTFTASKAPTPRWVSVIKDTIDDQVIDKAAVLLRAQLARDPGAIDRVGGKYWWTIRGRPLKGEWVEKRSTKLARGSKVPERVILYFHGGAYFFSSLETHRYQVQRHARKLNGVAFAPEYRLAPQYPFPCGLHDALSSYLWLIDPPPNAAHAPIPSRNIVLSGDSSGAGSVLALLAVIRDQNLPMPCGASLISPWCDLAHSFPSISSERAKKTDYIPNDGFQFKPDIVWPPLPSERESITVEGRVLDNQIQPYCSNSLIGHPLVSSVLQGSLHGLPPLLIIAGSGEFLADEIVYMAHKIADPGSYPPPEQTFETYPSMRKSFEEGTAQDSKKTRVYLSMFDGCCHVVPTLSITKPAKYMYRRIASFHLSVLDRSDKQTTTNPLLGSKIKVTGRELDSFATTKGGSMMMVRERVSADGHARPMEPIESIRALYETRREDVGRIKLDGPIERWLSKRAHYDRKYAHDLKTSHALKQAALVDDSMRPDRYFWLDGSVDEDAMRDERPPVCSVAACKDERMARDMAKSVDIVKRQANAALVVWSKISAQPDEEALKLQQEAQDKDSDKQGSKEEK